MSRQREDVVSWSWTPASKFTIDLKIGDKAIITEIDASEREFVAMGLARLADAAMGTTRTLVWRWEDGAESDLDGVTIKEPPDDN